MDIIVSYETVFIRKRYAILGRRGRNLALQRIWVLRTHSLQSVKIPVSILERVRGYFITMLNILICMFLINMLDLYW